MSENAKVKVEVDRGGITGLYQKLLWLSDYMPADAFMMKALDCTEDNIKWARRVAREDGFEIIEVSASDVRDTRNTTQSRWWVTERPSPPKPASQQLLPSDPLEEIKQQLARLQKTIETLQEQS